MDTKKLRQKILDLAIHGKLVPQDPNDEPASVLLERIRAEKERMIAEGKIKRSKKSATSDTSHYENVPEGWVLTDIGELLINRDSERVPLSRGVRSKQKNKIYDYYGATGVVDKVDGYLFDERLLLIGEDGANLLSRSKDNAFFAEGKYWVNNHAHILDCPAKEVLDYVAFIINSISLEDYITGSAQPKLNQDNLNKIEIPLPPLEEQRRIIAQVNLWQSYIKELEVSETELQDSVQSAKSKILDLAIHGKLVPQDTNDEPASELLKRINPKAVASCDNPHYENVPFAIPSNWVTLSLLDICDNINGLWTGKKPPFVRVGVIRNANFTKDFKLDYSKIEYIEVEEKSFEKRHLLNGDIIVEKSGGSEKNPVGRAILYEGDDKKFSYSNFTMILRIKDHCCVNSKYLYYYLMAVYIRGDMRKLQTQTTGLHNLILDSYLSMSIYLPPFEEQKRISNKIGELFKSLEAIANTLK